MRVLAAVALCLTMSVQTVSAQSAFDKVVGPDEGGQPLEFRAFTTHAIGALARAAHVPIGFESLPAPARRSELAAVVLTGKTVREAAALMTALDGRYAVREDDGVVVFEPAEPIYPQPLDAGAPAVRLERTTGRDALALVAALLGAPRTTAIEFGDVKPFALDAPEGTIRSLLNAIVRAHGELVWMLERKRGPQAMFPYMLHFLSGPFGFGLGLSGGPPVQAIDVSRFLRVEGAAAELLDRIVGTRADGYPLELTAMSPSAIWDLVRVIRAPFGIEVARGGSAVARARPFTATGRPLREVLDALVANDLRYEWRVVDGTIVVRPATAWGDANNPLFTLVPDVELHDATMTAAVRAVTSALSVYRADMTIGDSKTVSLSVVHGTALDLLVALTRAHGEYAWSLDEAEPKEVEATGLTHRLTLYGPGSGGGFLVGIGRARSRH